MKLSLYLPAGRRLEVREGDRLVESVSARVDERFELEFELSGAISLSLVASGGGPTASQLENGDPRELGFFLSEIAFRCEDEWVAEPLHSSQLISEDGLGLSAFRFALPLNRGVVRRADGFIVHSEWMREKIIQDRNAPTPVLVVPHGVERRWEQVDREKARMELPEEWRDDFIVASLGALQPHKRVAALLDGAARARERGLNLRVLLIGEERPRELDLSSEIRRLDLGGCVEVTGWVEEEKAHGLLCAADVCVNLRGPSTGGASGGASQALGLGRGVIVSDLPELAELPPEAVLKVPVGEGEAEALCEHFMRLQREPALLEEMERCARIYVDEQAHWSHVAETCVEALKRFPTPRASRRAIIHNAIKQRTAQAQ
jgi:glycosyltransferase involved in cell wall biosynthesis